MMSDYQQKFISVIKHINSPLTDKFISQINRNEIARSNNPATHFCCFFAPIDIKNKSVFIGLHKKSNLWLFNGGHMELDELPIDTVIREAVEELGLVPENIHELIPEYLSYIRIENSKRSCKEHYDIWYFIPVDKDSFNPDKNLLSLEFLEVKWLDIAFAEKVCEGQYSLQALEFIRNKYFKDVKNK